MITENTPLLKNLAGRGLIAQVSGSGTLEQHLKEASRVVYCGFDPTADSLHIGHLVPLLMLKRMQLAGHKPLALIGGATGMIGDPSFKANERVLNTRETVDEWCASLKKQISQFIDFDCGEQSAVIINNADWVGSIDILSFLRDVGKHFSVNTMIGKESVRQRIERDGQGISFTEFSYMLLQSYDFAVLNRDYGCSVQIGGNDQWGNITSGIDLTRRMNREEVFGMTLPLVTKADGTKFGKTESGAVWLDPAKTSPYAFYQFWLKTSDEDVYKFLHYYTFLSENEIAVIAENDAARDGKPQAQEVLAQELTRLVHGDEELRSAMNISKSLFSGNVAALSEKELAQLELDGMPLTIANDDESLITMLVETELASSRKMAREYLSNGAVEVNGVKESDVDRLLSRREALNGKYYFLKRGKKLFHLVSIK